MSVYAWAYPRRDPIAWVSALALTVMLVLPITQRPFQPRKPDRSIEAFLERVVDQPAQVPPSRPVPVVAPAVTPPLPAPPAAARPTTSPIVPETPLQPSAEAQPTIAAPKPAATASAPAAAPAPAAESRPELPPSPVPRQTALTSLPPLAAVPPPAAAAGALSAGYESQLITLLERNKRYPTGREARLTRPRGIVRVWLELSRAGQLQGTGIEQSSGSNLLDQQTLATVRGLSYPPFPEQAFAGMATHRFVVNLSYELTN